MRATAVFDPDLREALAEARLTWIGELTDLLGRIHRAAPTSALTASAERLTAALEGLSSGWLSEVLPLTHARQLMRETIAVELAICVDHASLTEFSVRVRVEGVRGEAVSVETASGPARIAPFTCHAPSAPARSSSVAPCRRIA